MAYNHQVLAENVANADSPNYKTKDIKPLSFKNTLSMTSTGLHMSKTNEAHFAAGNDNTSIKIQKRSQDFQSNATGNNVVLEEEMMKAAETSADYQLATNLYKKSVGLFRLAISKS